MAAGRGVRVAPLRKVPGVCVNVGCVPKKLFVYGAESEQQRIARYYGWDMPSQ